MHCHTSLLHGSGDSSRHASIASTSSTQPSPSPSFSSCWTASNKCGPDSEWKTNFLERPCLLYSSTTTLIPLTYHSVPRQTCGKAIYRPATSGVWQSLLWPLLMLVKHPCVRHFWAYLSAVSVSHFTSCNPWWVPEASALFRVQSEFRKH